MDASNPQKEKHMEVVYETLKQLGAVGSDVITVFNKMDLVEHDMVLKDPKAQVTVKISARTGEGVDELLS